MDAYTGEVKLYAWDGKDPVLKAWRSVFPGLVQDASAMPTDIRDHVRYPEDLFEVQRAMLTQYHVDDPVTFYNVNDKWTVPDDPTNTSGSQPPYYILAAPPDSTAATGDQSEFQLTSPMNVNSSTYLAAYMSVDNDPSPENYGKITVLRLPKGTQAVQGPEQVYNKITTDSTITKDLTFFNSPGGGSTVVHGNLLTLPIGNSFLYVEPLYNRSSSGTSGTYPVLVRVIMVYGDRIGYGASLADALTDFLPGHQTGQTLATINNGGSGPTTSPTTGTTPPPTSGSSSPTTTTTTPPPAGSVTLTELTQAEAGLQAALKSGDYEKIGAAQAKVNELLQQYLEQNPPAASSSPTSVRVQSVGGLPVADAARYAGGTDAGWSSSVARWAHNPEVAGSNPAPATTDQRRGLRRNCAGALDHVRVCRRSIEQLRAHPFIDLRRSSLPIFTPCAHIRQGRIRPVKTVT